MRTIKFRGKRIDNKEWVYGYLYKLPLPSGDACMILTQDNNHLDNSLEPEYDLAFTLWVDLFVVDPATIGQYTGLHDKNGKKIFEGDVIKCGMRLYVCEFIEGGFEFRDLSDSKLILKAIVNTSCIIGNIHDNLELIEKGGEKC